MPHIAKTIANHHWASPILVGGSSEECLKEIEILLQALDIDYTLDHNFVY